MANQKTKPIEVVNALHELGLTLEIIKEALERGEIARDSCTKNDPPSAPGYDAWAKTVRALRDILIPRGWERNDDLNFSTIISPDKSFAIAVATGNSGTGRADKEPNIKYSRGKAAKSAINGNQQYLPSMEPTAEELNIADRTTWILLKRREGDTLFAELSLPARMTEEGFVDGWETRIIFEPLLIDPALVMQDDSTEDIDVPVRRRDEK